MIDFENYLAISHESPSGLVWLVSPRLGVKAGDDAFYLKGDGYYAGGLKGKKYYAHRVIFYLKTGLWPKVVDHIDGNTMNNHPDNLRSSSFLENQHNRVAKGYRFHKRDKKWEARIKVNGKQIFLGAFSNEHDAHEAYLTAKKKYHPTSPARCFRNEIIKSFDNQKRGGF